LTHTVSFSASKYTSLVSSPSIVFLWDSFAAAVIQNTTALVLRQKNIATIIWLEIAGAERRNVNAYFYSNFSFFLVLHMSKLPWFQLTKFAWWNKPTTNL